MTTTRSQPGEEIHGGLNWQELRSRGIDPRCVVDLSSNLLFTDHPKGVRRAIEGAAISRYPDRDCGELSELLAKRHGIAKARILAGNGCCELIHLVAGALLKPGHRVLVIGPTFSEYARASRLADAEVHEIRSASNDGFAVPIDAIHTDIEQNETHVVWICNPNNPTGQATDSSVIQRWAQAFPETIFVVDESYIEFSLSTKSLVAEDSPNVIVLRSMTKSHALAGLRLGYLVASESQMELLIERRIPWSVNELAQVVGTAALQSESHYDDAMSQMRTQRSRLYSELEQRGYHPLPSETGFVLLPVENAAALRDQLLGHGVLIRDCSSFGLEKHVRIAVGDQAANNSLLNAIDGRDTVLSTANAARDDARAPIWETNFRTQLYELFRMRRNVRRFRGDLIDPELLSRWIDAACMAPSVGLSQPWRFLSVNRPSIRDRVAEEFEMQNDLAAADYEGTERQRYQQLKLAGLREAPEHLAIFVDPEPEQGRGLGRRTMPDSVAYSVVAAIQNFWLAARCDGVGVGWVSILRPQRIGEILSVPDDWKLIAYLCVGYPLDASQEIPDLELEGWQERVEASETWWE